MTVLPGPSAVLTALVAAGIIGDGFRFVGYLPRRARELESSLAAWRRCGGLLVAFDTGQRLARSLAVLAAHLPDARAAVCRELTKVHEDVVRGTLLGAERALSRPRPRRRSHGLGARRDHAGDRPGACRSAPRSRGPTRTRPPARCWRAASRAGTRPPPCTCAWASRAARRSAWRARWRPAAADGGPSARLWRMDLFALIADRPLLFDGGLGRALMERGFAAGECPEEWNVSHPAEVEDIHRSFYAAGSDIVNTNTFGGTAMRLEAHGLSARAVELNEAGARLAAGVRDREFPGRWVAGDIGPCGQMVRPMGNAEPDALRATFAEQARALVAGGVDLLNIETMFDLTEATIAVEAAVAAAGRTAGAGQHDLQAGRQGLPHHDGREPGGRRQGAQGRRRRPRRAATARSPPSRWPIWSPSWPSSPAGSPTPQPNAGQPRLEAGETVYAETPEHFAAVVATYPALGAGIVGGCCGTPPASIAALAAALGR